MTTNNSTTIGNHTLEENSLNDVSFDNLYPAIIQCFIIILLGYIAGRANILSSTQGRGIGNFVSTFCLPALLFQSMCTLNFQAVDWMFLLSIFVSKTLLFIAVVIITLLAKRPMNYGLAGIYAIFVTQSNDFALGYPILKALYKNSHPEYLDYIYLIAPISVMFLNPIGFAMLEIQKRRSSQTHITRCKMFLHVAKDVISNPLVFMTFIGIIGNFVFHHRTPVVLVDILNVLGEAFDATALFYLGLSLVGKVKGKSGLHLVTPLLLIGAKTLILPLITWQFVGSIDINSSSNDTMSVSMYGFLYGTFPTAPSVFLYASHYNIAMDTIATGLVAGTLLSAPIMFVSARMMTMGVNDKVDNTNLLLKTSISTSIIGLVCCVWMLFVLVFSRKYKRLPHQFLIFFIISQMVSCSGMAATRPDDTLDSWKHYITYSLVLIGQLSAKFFTAVMSLSLYLIHTYSLCFLLRIKWWLVGFSLGLPVLSTVCISLLSSCRCPEFEVDPSFVYGTCQSVTFLLSLLLCSGTTITCLVLRQRYHEESKSYSKLKNEDPTEPGFIVDDTNASKRKNEHVISHLMYSKQNELFLYIWRSFNNQLSDIYVEIEFLNCVFNYGQGFFVCALFGFDTKRIFIPFVKKFRKLIYGAEVIRLPNVDELEEETKQLCHQFIKYHMEGCKMAIVKDKKYRFREYKQVFTGTQFCDWLIEIGLTNDRGDAVNYGRSLLIGRVIEHVTSEHNFHDLPYFYRFTKTSSIFNET